MRVIGCHGIQVISAKIIQGNLTVMIIGMVYIKKVALNGTVFK